MTTGSAITSPLSDDDFWALQAEHEKERIVRLTCCCCGNRTKGRQWHNRDTGYGLCMNCIERCQRGETAESFRSCYGDKGIHYAIEE